MGASSCTEITVSFATFGLHVLCIFYNMLISVVPHVCQIITDADELANKKITKTRIIVAVINDEAVHYNWKIKHQMLKEILSLLIAVKNVYFCHLRA